MSNVLPLGPALFVWEFQFSQSGRDFSPSVWVSLQKLSLEVRLSLWILEVKFPAIEEYTCYC